MIQTFYIPETSRSYDDSGDMTRSRPMQIRLLPPVLVARAQTQHIMQESSPRVTATLSQV